MNTNNRMREDYKVNNINFNYKKGRETKNNSFLVSKQESIREEEEEEEEGGAKQRYGSLEFGMDSCMEFVRILGFI